jgi:hypothetical protein
MTRALLSFDAESNGLHGEVFAVGAVVLRDDGTDAETFFARCSVPAACDPWVFENVLPALAATPRTHETPRAMRDAFWQWLMARQSESVVVVDCGWPVEAGLLSACVADDPSRAMKGPYPLHEAASLLLAAGMDPMASYAERVLSPEALRTHRTHHPVDDARVSALCARMALAKVGVSL